MDYEAVVFLLSKKKNIRKIERHQRAAAKMTPIPKRIDYHDEPSTQEKKHEKLGLIPDLVLGGYKNTSGHGKEFKMSTCMKETIRPKPYTMASQTTLMEK